MGLERVAAVMQGVHDNYDTDTFKALIAESGALTHTATTGANQASHRVIADHLRCSGFLVADGVLPANEGRGYVLPHHASGDAPCSSAGCQRAVDVSAGAGAGRRNGSGLSRLDPRPAADRGDDATGKNAFPSDARQRSEESRVGKECGSTWRFGGLPVY